MVIAGVTISEKDEKKLLKFGVKDSKQLSPKRRVELAKKIEKLAKNIVVLRVQPCKIDSFRDSGINLDKIEAMKMAEIIEMSNGDRTFIDSLQQNPKKFENLILGYLKNKEADLVVKNYLDESIPVVGAASIVAKTERDSAIEEIKRKVNFDFGVGYPHDERTLEFVRKLIKESKGKELPSFVRKSWITTQVLQEESLQKKIKDFFLKREKCKEDKDDT